MSNIILISKLIWVSMQSHFDIFFILYHRYENKHEEVTL
jgi:hypothetical protein